MITDKLADRTAFTRWFGEYNSTPKYPEQEWRPEEPTKVAELRELLAGGEALCRNPASRFSFVRQDAGEVLLFVDGTCFECPGEVATFAEILCAQDKLIIDAVTLESGAAMDLIVQLFNQGSLVFEADD